MQGIQPPGLATGFSHRTTGQMSIKHSSNSTARNKFHAEMKILVVSQVVEI